MKALIGLTIYDIWESGICPVNRIYLICKVLKKKKAESEYPQTDTHLVGICTSYCLIPPTPTPPLHMMPFGLCKICVWDHLVVPGALYRPLCIRCFCKKAVTWVLTRTYWIRISGGWGLGIGAFNKNLWTNVRDYYFSSLKEQPWHIHRVFREIKNTHFYNHRQNDLEGFNLDYCLIVYFSWITLNINGIGMENLFHLPQFPPLQHEELEQKLNGQFPIGIARDGAPRFIVNMWTRRQTAKFKYCT